MSDQQQNIIKLEQVSRHYHMGEHTVKALDEITFDIKSGEFVTIVGSSGSGKSTMMNILGCLDQPSQGHFELSGHNVSATDDDTLSKIRNKHIGFVFQQFNLLHDLSVEENIALPLAYQGVELEERVERARLLAERFQLADRVHHKPYELSGGQAQRVAIMRALVTNPDILLLDEPTGALDSKTGREIMDIFHELHESGLTIIMVTHDNKLAQEGTRCIRLRDGQIEEDVAVENAKSQATQSDKESDAAHLGSALKHGLSWSDLMRVGIREGILTHKLRSALTMLGIIIGVASVIAMSSFSLGSKKKQLMQIRELGVNQINIKDARLEGEQLNEARSKGSAGLSLQDVELVKSQINGIQRSCAYRSSKIRINIGGFDMQGLVYGVDGPYFSVNNLQLSQGITFSELDHLHANRVAVIGSKIAAQLPYGDPLGQQVNLGTNPFTIIGVLEDKNVNVTALEANDVDDMNNIVLIPFSTLSARTAHVDMRSELDSIQLQLFNEDDLDHVGLSAQRIITASHNGVNDFNIEVPLDLLKQKQQSQALLDVLTLCVSSISLIVGGIGIMNIMLASVTERLKEIGIRRAIGATQQDIKYQFLTESVALSVVGGLIGIVFSALVVFVAGFALDIPPVFSPWMISISVCAAIATGLIFGLYPAVQAAQKSVVEILRNE